MSEQYIRELLRVAVAQICQTIGYNATQTAPLELLQDVLHKFLQEFSRDMRRQVEHYNRTEANLNDTCLTLNSLNINVGELLDYINNVEPVPFAVEVPKFPARKDSNLNFLKPGSKEVLTRPVHIYEHLPPILPPDPSSSPNSLSQYMLNGNAQDKSALSTYSYEQPASREEALVSNSFEDANKPKVAVSSDVSAGVAVNRRVDNKEFILTSSLLKTTSVLDEEGRPTREISSVVMTTGGFISPAIEGKLADAIMPEFIVKLQGYDAPPLPPPISRPPSRSAIEIPANTGFHHTSGIDFNVNDAPTTKNFDSMPTKTLSSIEPSPSTTSIAASKTQTGNEKAEKFVSLTYSETSPKKSISLFQNTTPHAHGTPAIASKLLKKAKKKSPNTPFPMQGKHNMNATDLDSNPIDAIEKAQRRCMKMSQKKRSKSAAKSVDAGSAYSQHSSPEEKVNLAYPERFQMKKMTKKHSKFNQKMLSQITQSHFLFPKGLLNKKDFPTDVNTMPTGPSLQPNELKEQKFDESDEHVPSSSTKFPEQSKYIDTCKQTPPDGDLNWSPPEMDNEMPNVLSTETAIEPIEQTNVENIKLSTEPDRSKLNIIKKISKQKGAKSVSPNMSVMVAYGGNESEGINLPSGTTITPTSSAVNRHIYPPDVSSDEQFGENATNSAAESVGSVPTTPGDFGGLSGEHLSLSLISKPKKRGRKPGSKNHAKLPALEGEHNTLLKEAKKLKMDKNLFSPNINPTNPSKLSMDQFYGFLPKKSAPLSGSGAMSAVEMRKRKDRKKLKTKNIPTSTMTSGSTEEIASIPTFEEVSSINKKLMRIDTVLQPLMSGALPEHAKKDEQDSALHSPEKNLNASTKSPGSKKRSLQQKSPANTAPKYFNSPPFMPGFPPSMSMMPLYQFAPRPGLIPPPGLFPTTAPGLFPNNAKNSAASNIFVSKFFQLPYLKSTAGRKTPIQGLDSSEHNEKHFEPSPSLQLGERSYCNVAPLVPESMKFTPPQKAIEKDVPITPKLRNPTLSDIAAENLIKKLNVNTSESSSVGSKSIPATPGAMFLNMLDANKTASSQLSGSSFLSNIGTPHHDMLRQTSNALNINDPIELSDDSLDASPTAAMRKMLQKQSTKPKLNPLKSTPVADGGKFDEIFTRIGSSSESLPHYFGVRDAKKQKKNKFSKKHALCNSTPSPSSSSTTSLKPLDVFVTEKGGVSKLAGGADLIPLAVTGVAYSAKTIPPDSLTAPAASEFVLHKKETASPQNFLSGITITPTTSSSTADLQKKRKEHKKLKRIKEGKIKKKKDKKDKSKSKERDEKHMAKSKDLLKNDNIEKFKNNKDLLKKLKKEKKKEKQRNVVDSVADSNAMPSNNDKFGTSLLRPYTSPTYETSLSVNTATDYAYAAPALIPKLTLKLGNCPSPTPPLDNIQQAHNNSKIKNTSEREKREPSPELARISPLVTRPPKQKSSTEPAAQLTSTLGIATGTAAANLEFSNENSKVQSSATSNNSAAAVHTVVPPPSPWLPGSTLTASSVLLPQQLLQNAKASEHLSSAIATPASVADSVPSTSSGAAARTSDRKSPVPLISDLRPSSYIDAEGNRVWICPACGRVDDGSAMIGCDGCDAWYHWVCVGILVAPKDNEDWFCRVCVTRKKGMHGSDKKRKRNKKNK